MTPVGASTPSESQLRALLGAWSLGQVVSVTRAEGGATNLVYRVEAGSGVTFLRIYRRADRNTALREHALIEHAQARGIPAPLPIASTSGETVVEHGGQRCALYQPARGVQLSAVDLSAEQARSAGVALAKLHRATEQLPDVGYVRWGLAWDGAAWVERLVQVEQALLAAGVADETDEWALSRVREQQGWLRDPACAQAYAPRFPAQVTHGDYQPANWFFEGADFSAIIDWEQGAFMPRAYEVARAAGFLVAGGSAFAGAFVAAYVAHSGIEPAELEDGARAWACFSDHHVWAVEEAYLHGNAAARRYIPRRPFRPFFSVWSEVIEGL
ncbi:MAG TPA: phosphotransferase [Polyangiaceae bacterium]|nr:phosphotransferase [Polyangiaceae bacterium]